MGVRLKNTYTASVGEIVEFCCRQGDLWQENGPAVDARAGIVAHKRVQKAGGKSYQAEVVVEFGYESNGHALAISGRADGVIDQQDLLIVEEIKTTWLSIDDINPDAMAMHLAQAKLYAYGLLLEKRKHCIALPKTEIRLCYYNLNKKRAERKSEAIEFDQLQSFVEGVLATYLAWRVKLDNAREQRREAIKNLSLPFGDFRPNQRELAEAAYKTLATGRRLLTQAPTGTGKTMAQLFPALKAQSGNSIDKVYYLTAKVSGQKSAVEALDKLNTQTFHPSAIVLTAKEKICPCKQEASDDAGDNVVDEKCGRCVGFFDRLPAARDALYETAQEKVIDAETLVSIAEQHHLCPFELALDALAWLDVVIADYNYVFDPLVRLSRHLEVHAKQSVLLIDEAHNLPERSRSAYSGEINPLVLLQSMKPLRRIDRRLANNASKLLTTIEDVSQPPFFEKIGQSGVLEDIPKPVTDALETFFERVEVLRANQTEFPEALTSLFKMLYRFEAIRQLMGDAHTVVVERIENTQRSKLALINLCPAELNAEQFIRFRAISAFSASLVPMAFYANTIGLHDTQFLSVPSPFDANNAAVLVCPFVDMRYGYRDQYLTTMVDLIASTLSAKRGNYLVCLPSYKLIEDLTSLCESRLPEYEWLQQQREHQDDEKHALIHRLQSTEKPSVLMAISGGWYAEGVDLPGEALIGMIHFGVGLPQVSDERRMIQRFLDGQYPGQGFAYAFEFPGFNRVLQSAGRVVRTPEDKGIIVLVDQRFSQNRYQSLFPPHWRYRLTENTDDFSQSLAAFWSDVQAG